MAPDALPDKKRVKWYLRPVAILIALITVGPLAMPMIWISPALKRWQMIALTAIVVLLTVWIIKASVDLYRILLRELRNIQEVLK